VAVETWRNFESVVLLKFGVNLDINEQSIIDGFDVKPKIINEIAIHIKKSLHKPMSIRNVVSSNQINSLFNLYEKISNSIKIIKVNKKC